MTNFILAIILTGLDRLDTIEAFQNLDTEKITEVVQYVVSNVIIGILFAIVSYIIVTVALFKLGRVNKFGAWYSVLIWVPLISIIPSFYLICYGFSRMFRIRTWIGSILIILFGGASIFIDFLLVSSGVLPIGIATLGFMFILSITFYFYYGRNAFISLLAFLTALVPGVGLLTLLILSFTAKDKELKYQDEEYDDEYDE